ncbi:MAG: diguanylate cyclase [Gammaproteobacteria bacterium]|nr:diguanylate cyclase [Gammaproteobacteria bacterium]
MDRLHKIINDSQAVIFYWLAEAGWPVDYVSENISMYGYSKSDFLTGRISYPSIIHSEDVNRVLQEVAHFTEGHQDKFRQVYRIITSEGKTCWIEARTVIERNDAQAVLFYLGTIVDITEQKKIEHYNQLLGNVVEQSTAEIYIFDRENYQFKYLNPTALQACNVTLAESVELTPLDLNMGMSVEAFKAIMESLSSDTESQKPVIFETTKKNQTGVLYPIEVTIRTVEIECQNHYVAVVIDVSEKKALAAENQRQHDYTQAVLDGLSDEVMVIRTDYTVEWMNQAARKKVLSAKVRNSSAPKCYELSHGRTTPCDGHHHPCPLTQVMASKKEVRVIHNHGSEGRELFVQLTAKPLTSEDGEVISIVESSHDITSLIQAQNSLTSQAEAMAYQASHDVLTGLANRRLFFDRLEQSVLRSKRLKQLFAVAFIDIDKFKAINDSLGHAVGDEVLQGVANRLRNTLRATDTVARLGGDEFTLLIEGFETPSDAISVLDKVMALFLEPIETESGSIQVTISMGVAIFPEDAEDHKTLVHQADLALYEVKNQGRNGYKLFNELAL